MLKQCSISQHGQKRTPYFSWPRKHISAPFSWQKCQLPEDQKDQCRNTGLYQRCKSLKAFFLFLSAFLQKNTPFLLFATVWHVKRREIQTQKPKEGICVFFYMTGKADPVLGRCQEMTSCSGLQNRRKTPCLLSFYFQRLSLRKCSAQSLCQSLSIIRWNESCVNSFRGIS